MPIKVLVIGYGSIGRRHADILNEMDKISEVVVLSSQSNLPFKTIKSTEEIPGLDPDYLVVTSNTALHHEQLVFVDNNLQGRKILMEKPLFDVFHDLEIRNNQVFVGYNLRFHPLIQLIKEKITDKKLWNIQIFCGSYLPDWRPDRDYQVTSSAKKETGGGVLLDLSHELDYVQWLTGEIDIINTVNEKVSDFKIDTDDILVLSGKSESGAYVHITLNYFTRKPIRQFIIDGEGISIHADLIANLLFISEQGKTSEFSWPELSRNETYKAQHNAIINDDLTFLCTFKEGLETMRLIDNIKSFN